MALNQENSSKSRGDNKLQNLSSEQSKQFDRRNEFYEVISKDRRKDVFSRLHCNQVILGNIYLMIWANIKKVNNSKISSLMRRRGQSKSSRKVPKKTSSPRKQCPNCLIKCINYVHISRSLYRKYSYSQNHFYLEKINNIDMNEIQRQSTNEMLDQEYMDRYHKNNRRKVILNKIKEVYKMHRDIPRIFMSNIKDILFKCYHRKRLIEYFKIAKLLGIKVDSLAFSSFMLSLHLPTYNTSKTYQKLLIEETNASPVAERRILSEIGSQR